MRVGLGIRVGIKMRLRLKGKATERCTPRSRIPLENLSVSSCDWSLWCQQGGGGEGGGEHLREEEWDLIIGSDLIYNEAGVHMLPQVFKGLLSSGRATAYYCHTKHRCLHPRQCTLLVFRRCVLLYILDEQGLGHFPRDIH